MKYEAQIDDKHVTVELEERDGRVTAVVDGRSYELEVARPEEGVYLIFEGAHVYEARAWQDDSKTMRVRLRERVFAADIIDRKQRRMGADHGIEGRQLLTAPMPGKVVRVLLKADDEVGAGQGVVVVEAMKMQNEVKSPKAGRVVEVCASEGATVNAGQVLAIVE